MLKAKFNDVILKRPTEWKTCFLVLLVFWSDSFKQEFCNLARKNAEISKYLGDWELIKFFISINLPKLIVHKGAFWWNCKFRI